MGSEKHKKEKKEKKDKKEKKEKKDKKEKKEKKDKRDSDIGKKRSRNVSKDKDKKRDEFQKPKPPNKTTAEQSRGFRFDSPPKDPLQNTPFSNFKSKLIDQVSLGEFETILPANPLQNPLASLEALQAMTPLIQMQRLQQLRAQADVKADRKLYVGNLPPNSQPKELQDFLNQTLLKMGVSSEHAGSICNCWIDSNGHFGFIEFRSPEEATQGFILKDVIFKGHQLKIGRPKSFLTSLAAVNQQMMSEQAFNPLSSMKGNDKDSSSLISFRPLKLMARYVQIPTNILVIKNVLTLEDVTIDEEFNDIMEDIREECSKFGTVKNVIIPRPEFGKLIVGVGKMFIEYEKTQEARTARRYLAGRMYGDKTVECEYLSREKWAKRQFTDLNEDILRDREEQQRLDQLEQERIKKQMQEEMFQGN